MKRFVLTLLALCVLAIAPRTLAADTSGVELAVAATPEPTSAVPSASFSLRIDNEDIFPGMTSPYQDGYVPVTQDGVCQIILPLRGDGGPAAITASVNLGDPSASPFVFENYEKTVPLKEHETQSGAKRLCYLVDLSLPLTQNAAPGRYPVTITCAGTGPDGTPFQQEFVVYATVEGPEPEATPDPSDNPDGPAPLPGSGEGEGDLPTDSIEEPDGLLEVSGGSDPGTGGASGAAPTETPPVLQPKLMLTSYSVNPSPAQAGQPFAVTFTLTNTSEKQLAQNVLLTVAGETADVVPADETASMFYANIAPGKSVTATVSMTSAPTISPGPQKIQISAGYDDSKGTAYTSQETAVVQVRQPVRFAVDAPDVPATVHAGDTINLSVNVMNLGRSTISNLMAKVDADWLVEQNTLFLGNVESGTAKKGTLYVFVRPPETQDGAIQHGTFEGTLNVTCEDEYGGAYTQTLLLSTYVEEQVIAPEPTEEPEEQSAPANQWWISLVVAGCIAAGTIAVWVAVHRKKAERNDDEDE